MLLLGARMVNSIVETPSQSSTNLQVSVVPSDASRSRKLPAAPREVEDPVGTYLQDGLPVE